MAELAGWIALGATCIAALMTASNLGARVTGWGFVVFTAGAVAWIVVGFTTDQTQLLWSNIFLGLVDLFGVWRWLGVRAWFSDAAEAEQKRSQRAPGDNLLAMSKINGMPVTRREGAILAHVVDALASCDGGRLSHLIVRVGGVAGVGETLHKLAWADVTVRDGALETHLDDVGIARLALSQA